MAAEPKLLVQVRNELRARHYSYRTEQAVHGVDSPLHSAHPRDMSGAEVEQFLTLLAVERWVSASTQNHALAAIPFLYRQVLEIDLPWLEHVARARRPARLPVVLSQEEVRAVLSYTECVYRIIAQLLYGGGLRLMEALRLRVKDVDFQYAQIVVRDGKGRKDRVTVGVRSPLD